MAKVVMEEVAVKAKAKGTAVDMTAGDAMPMAAVQCALTRLVVEDNPGRVEGDKKSEDLELAVKLAGNTILEPLIVKPSETAGNEGKFKVVDGRRRLAVAKKMGLKTVPVVLDSSTRKVSDTAKAILSNITRPLTPVEILKAMQDISAEKGWDISLPATKDGKYGKDVDKLAEWMGISRAKVYVHLRLSLLSEGMLKNLHNGEVAGNVGLDLAAAVAKGTLSQKAAEFLMSKSISLADAEAEEKELKAKKAAVAAMTPEERKKAGIKADGSIDYSTVKLRPEIKEQLARERKMEGKGKKKAKKQAGRKELKQATVEAVTAGEIPAEAGAAVTSGVGYNAQLTLDRAAEQRDVLDELLEHDNKYVVRMAGALIRHTEDKITSDQLREEFGKNCKIADDAVIAMPVTKKVKGNGVVVVAEEA